MKHKTLLAIAFEIGFAGVFAVAQTAAPPAGQPTGAPPAATAPKPAAPKPVVKKPPTQVESVIQLAKAGMSEAFIIKYLQKNNKPADLTPTDMVKLKEAGVSETVIGVMMDPTSAPAPVATPAPDPVPVPAPVAVAPPPPPEPVPAPAPVAPPAPAPVTTVRVKAPAARGDWKGAIEDKIQESYPLTQLTGDKSDIVTPGAVLMLKKNGLVMYTGIALATANTYKGGRITQNLLGALQKNSTDGTVKTFVKGEKFWITQIDVKDDGLYLQFISDPLPDSRYHGTLRFPWAKNTQPQAEEIATLVAEVVQNVGTPPAPAAQPAPQQMAPIAPPPPPDPALAPIAPPAPPPATLAVGQTKEQVIAAMGQPERIGNVGTKQILYFKNLKVTLVGGKVTAIE